MKWLRNIDWKGIWKASIEILKSIGRGDILLRMQVHRLFPYILYTFALACLSIWMSYRCEQTMLKVEQNRKTIENLKIDHARLTFELVGLNRISTVEKMLEEAGSEVKAPQKPADILK